ncbi:MAG: extradiol dioxygenase [Solimicrobium sp.]|jgi:predicted lactoylglutathione lyase|nr:extradiol dioxygenase [Solimicrobium sp.]
MTDLNYITYVILYVDNPIASSIFYADLLGKTPLEFSSTFVKFSLNSDVMLALWSKHTVEPVATATGGGGELALSVDSNDTVRTLYADWVKRGLVIIQAPTEMNFGCTFVASDPDGHRLRVFALSVL